MGDFLEKIYRNFREFFLELDFQRKMGLIVLFLFVVGGISAMIIWASKTRYATLYTDLNKEDAKQIARILEEKKISYQLSKDSKTISVPEEMVEQWRLELAMKGVTFSGTVGYEVFDKQAFGTSSFVQKVNKQRALEGELIKTILYFKGVKRARVHLSIPDEGPFVTEKKIPGASVVLELDDGVQLTAQEVKGIASLVSSSVEGMRTEDVIILDGRGKKLSENIGDAMTAQTANRVALESQLNKEYEQKIEEILGKVVGSGKIIAKVKLDLDFTQKTTTQTSYDNENTAVISEVKNIQKLKGSRPSPQGIPGARNNIPGETPQPGIPETRNDVDKELVTKNFNVPSTVTKMNRPTATISKVNVAVMLDGKKIPKLDAQGKAVIGEDNKAVMEYVAWSAADLENFKEIVASAIGIDSNRGDSIVIKNMQFVEENLEEVERILRARENRELIKNVAKYAAIGLAVALFFFIVVRPFVQWVTDNTVESVEDFLPKTLDELEKIQANQKLPGLEDALPQIEEKLNPEKIEGNMLREKIISLVEANPGKAAQIVTEMLHSQGSTKEIA